MDGLDYRSAFVDHAPSRTALNAFLIDIHGLDLTLWIERVGWDPGFVPFAFFEGDRVVAATCIYTVPMVVRGAPRKAAQISSVGTLPDFRRRGLNAELTRRALEWAAGTGHEGTFLFSDDDAVGFYEKQGFVERSEWRSRVPVATRPRPGARRLDFDADEPLIVRLVTTRTPVSSELGARCPHLELFHLLYENAGEMRYLQEFDLLACCEIEDGILKVHDLIGPELPPWSAIEPLVIDSGTRAIEFGITPDRLGLDAPEPVEDRSSRLHVFPGEDLIEGQVVVPWTAHA